MKLAFCALMMLVLSACVGAPVTGDPYTQAGAAAGAIQATQAAQQATAQANEAQATQRASLATAQGDAIAMAAYGTQTALDAQVQGTQMALDAQATALSLQATSQYLAAMERDRIATSTAYPPMATATQSVIATQGALMIAQAERENNEYTWRAAVSGIIKIAAWGFVLFGLVVICIRWIIPALDAKFDAWKEHQLVFEKSKTLFVFVPQLGRSVTLSESTLFTNAWIRSMMQPQGPARMSELLPGRIEPVQAQPKQQEPSGPVRLMLDALAVVDPEGNVIPSDDRLTKDGRRWGSQSWQSAVNALKREGLVYTIEGKGTYVASEIGTLQALAQRVMQSQGGANVPSPTVEYVNF
jgi:hypothetical protein